MFISKYEKLMIYLKSRKKMWKMLAREKMATKFIEIRKLFSKLGKLRKHAHREKNDSKCFIKIGFLATQSSKKTWKILELKLFEN